METRILRYFTTIVQEGNINRAAEALHITQPTLSRQLAQFEEDLGVKLFYREKHRLNLTSEGQLLHRRAREILALVDKAEAELGQGCEFVTGHIAITCGEIGAVRLLTEIIQSFKEKYPQITYSIYTCNADISKERIDNGLADLALLLEPVDIERYDFVRLPVTEHWGILMRADDKLAAKEAVVPADLIGKNIIVPWRSKVRQELRSWFGAECANINPPMRSNMSTNASIMVYNGLGYAFCMAGGRPFLDESKVVCKPLQPPLTTSVALAWKTHQRNSITVSKFIAYVREYLQQIEKH